MTNLDETRIVRLMKELIKRNGSDLHLTENTVPFFRVQGQMMPADSYPISSEIIKEELELLIGKNKFEKFITQKDFDCSFGLDGLARFRLNLFFDRGNISCVMRALNNNIPSFSVIGLPESVQQLLNRPRGLVLVTGPTGSGKTTTLASGLNWINNNQSSHILTIEDPIEFIFENKNCLIRQREIGEDTKSYANALRGALREDPDIILIGEMRDLETISLAITAAETGHLVLGTLHTSSASQTIDRIIDVFPTAQQQQIRVQLSSSLVGVISQTLCKSKDGKRYLAAEIMVNNNAIANLIRESKSTQIYSQIQIGAKFGMQTLEQSLSELINKGLISREEAFNKCNRSNVLSSLVEIKESLED
tara:strand:+ start:74 stop:1162 length:1089 start_codon:yes stop_codon:yes gene_type:complete